MGHRQGWGYWKQHYSSSLEVVNLQTLTNWDLPGKARLGWQHHWVRLTETTTGHRVPQIHGASSSDCSPHLPVFPILSFCASGESTRIMENLSFWQKIIKTMGTRCTERSAQVYGTEPSWLHLFVQLGTTDKNFSSPVQQDQLLFRRQLTAYSLSCRNASSIESEYTSEIQPDTPLQRTMCTIDMKIDMNWSCLFVVHIWFLTWDSWTLGLTEDVSGPFSTSASRLVLGRVDNGGNEDRNRPLSSRQSQ